MFHNFILDFVVPHFHTESHLSPLVLSSGCIEQPDIVSTNGTFVAGIFLLIIDKFVNFNAEVAVFIELNISD